MAWQEARGGSFLPAFFVGPTELQQEFNEDELPAHLEMFPPVHAPFKPEYAAKMRDYIEGMKPFKLIVAEPVEAVGYDPQLMALHRKMLAALQYMPDSFAHKMPYSPRLALPPRQKQINTGDSMSIEGFSILEHHYHQPTWHIIGKIGLMGADFRTDIRLLNKDTEK